MKIVTLGEGIKETFVAFRNILNNFERGKIDTSLQFYFVAFYYI